MKKLLLTITVFLTLFASGLSAQDEAGRILLESDRFRGDWPSVIARTRIDNYEGERLSESADFEVSIKGSNSLVRFLSTRSKGQSLLMRGDDMWFYLPAVA